MICRRIICFFRTEVVSLHLKDTIIMKHIIDIDTWERRDNYLFFKGALNAWVDMTTEIDCTRAFDEAKKNGTSFFTRYLYAVLRAANEVKEYRYRKDKNGNVCLYDRIDCITPIAVPGRTFYSVRIPYVEDYTTFYQQARHIIDHIPHDRDPYELDKQLLEEGDFDVLCLSATPKLFFTAVTYPQVAVGRGQNFPLMNVGKAVLRGDRRIFPLSFSVSHEFVDGPHNAAFVEKVQQYMEE